MNFLTKDWKLNKDLGLLLLRIAFGLILIYGHGFEKISVILNGEEIKFLDPIGLGMVPSFYMAAFAEFVCAFLLIVGLFSSWATLILTINFLVILFTHAFIFKDGFGVLELRFLYLVIIVGLLLTGPGKYSLDYILNKNNK